MAGAPDSVWLLVAFSGQVRQPSHYRVHKLRKGLKPTPESSWESKPSSGDENRHLHSFHLYLLNVLKVIYVTTDNNI